MIDENRAKEEVRSLMGGLLDMLGVTSIYLRTEIENKAVQLFLSGVREGKRQRGAEEVSLSVENDLDADACLEENLPEVRIARKSRAS